VNATACGGAVAELLSRIIPIDLALGISADWRLIYWRQGFFTITKSFPQRFARGGPNWTLTAETRQAYLDRNLRSAEMLPEDYDLFIIHDPQRSVPALQRSPSVAK